MAVDDSAARRTGPWPAAPVPVMVPLFAVVYAAAVLVGRLSRLPGTSLSLVWPAAAVAFVWLLWASSRGRRTLAVSALTLTVLAGGINYLTGAVSIGVAAALGAANLVQGLTETFLVRRFRPDAWQLRRSPDLAVWVMSCVGGAAAGALLGPAALAATSHLEFWPLAGAWTLRNAANTFVFAALVLRVAAHGPADLVPPRERELELVLAVITFVVAYGVVFGFADGLPLAYLVLPLSMWFSLRFSTTVVAAHVWLVAAGVLLLTLAGHGPFAATSPATRVLLAQAFIAIVALVALLLALHRDERQELISQLRRARATADQQAQELRIASRHKSDFLATMSHEIRTPLNGVLGYTSLLAETPGSPQAGDWIAGADVAGHVLLDIVNDSLDMAKIEAGGIELEQVPLDLVAVAREALLPSQPRAEATGIDLRLEVADRLHAHRLGDPTRLRQVLTNLVANAVKFTERGSVTLTLEDAGDRVRLCVTDTGIGMDADQLRNLFTPFAQASADTTRRFGGTGLGLSIAQGLALAMGAPITVSSETGVGTRFSMNLTMPRTDPPVKVPAPRAAEPATGGLAGKRVLVAEDNETNQLIARAMLTSRGLDVSIVEDGEAAVGAVLGGQPGDRFDAVFMDVHMPGTDGLEATRRIRAAEAEHGRGERIPIIAMTANAFDDDRTACLDAGMDDFLPKPWKADQLAAVLGHLATGEFPRRRENQNS
ncbi:response regulator [Kineosporia sp. J2-2]|uniref:histidine kinase n=1 Tax=Kineosporia corallincola TaxID=2835133 RepID=A0ABS5TMT5_9ACTN|nr:ATP-binding protein [Kineosporia corallincola]MBT0771704.1 response regulator [Kineosporia corallincola]